MQQNYKEAEQKSVHFNETTLKESRRTVLKKKKNAGDFT